MSSRHLLSLSCLGALACSFASARIVRDGELSPMVAAKRTTIGTTVGSYEYVGCWTEPDGVRTLATFTLADNAMTLEMCAANCAGKYQFWGVEYGRECYCANSISSGSTLATDSDCSFPCAGNPEETCGAGLRISVFNSSTLVPLPSVVPTAGPYAYVGCQSESPNGIRALTASGSTSPDMTNKKCASACVGYSMFGTEYGGECYCGNELTVGSIPANESSCDMPCVGNGLELCGSHMKLNLYSHNPTSSTLTSLSSLGLLTSSTAPSATSILITSTFNSGFLILSTSSTSIPIQSPVSYSSATFTIESGTSILQIPVGPISPLQTAEWSHIGCFRDNPDHNMTRLLKNDSMTPELCMAVARERLTAEPATTYRYVGLEYGRECYAATSAPAPIPTSLTGRKACTMRCLGNTRYEADEMCGGRMQYDLYASVTGKVFSGPVPTTTT